MAQIDLAEVAAKAGKTALPDRGSLAFFVGGDAAVVFVPEGQSQTPVMPPAGTPDLTESGGQSDWRTDLAGRPLYPYWPVDLAVLDVTPPPGDDDDDAVEAFHEAEAAAVAKLFPRREYNLSPAEAFAGPPIPDWWQTAIHYAGYLEKAILGIPDAFKREQGMLDYALKRVEEAQTKSPGELKKAKDSVAMYERKIAQLHQLQPVLIKFAAEVSDLSKGRDGNGRDPWALMNPDEMAHLASFWARNREFAAFHSNQGDFPIAYLKKQMFEALPKADAPAFAALPAPVRDLINDKRAPRPQWWFMAVHYAKRLQEAAVHGVKGAAKWRQDSIESCRKRIAELQPKDSLGVFRRMLGPKKHDDKNADVAKLEASIAEMETKLDELRRLEPVFRQFVKEASDWAKDRDPWSLMQPGDVAQLDALMKRMREEFKNFDAYVPHRREDLETSALLAMASADERGYATLPERVRTLINRDYLLPAGGWHQMFGRGIEIQGNSSAMREEGYIMLLQLTYDDLMHWSFGDNGCYQFWISPADLAKRNWAGAKMTFECH